MTFLQHDQKIIDLRRRYNSSGKNGEDMANILAALKSQHPREIEQLELFEFQTG